MLTPSLLVFVAFLTVNLAQPQAPICHRSTEWRNYNRTCPPRAVCGQLIRKSITLGNGTICDSLITINYCFCGSRSCPTYDIDYGLLRSKFNRLYICQRFCVLPYCENHVKENTYFGPRAIAMTLHLFSPEFSYGSFERFHCRCRRNHYASSITSQEGNSMMIVSGDYKTLKYACMDSASDPVHLYDAGDPCVC